jgi:GH43 family beta-xylosidase
MSDPLTVSSARVLLTAPEQPWERVGDADLRRAASTATQRHDFYRLFRQRSWTVDYCLGMLVNRGW